jgi:hypothetical protein
MCSCRRLETVWTHFLNRKKSNMIKSKEKEMLKKRIENVRKKIGDFE